MTDQNFQPSVFGGAEESLVKIDINDDALGLGRATGGVAREIRKGPEGLLDRADRLYHLKEVLAPVYTARRDAKALQIRAEALHATRELLASLSPATLNATRMLIADYDRRFTNISATLGRAMPMIEKTATPEEIEEDWLGFAFEYIGGVSDDLIQELWARLLAQEANRPGLVSKRAVTKLSLMDRRSSHQLRNVLDTAISLYIPAERSNEQTLLYKAGRFIFPLMLEMSDWQGPRPDDDLVHGPMGIGHGEWVRTQMRWLHEEGFLRAISQDQLRSGYLNPEHWRPAPPRGGHPLAVRVGLGPVLTCDARRFIDMVRRYASDGATAQVSQLTGLAEALLDPRITKMKRAGISATGIGDDSKVRRDKIEAFLTREVELQPLPKRGHVLVENPGFLAIDAAINNHHDLTFYYQEY